MKSAIRLPLLVSLSILVLCLGAAPALAAPKAYVADYNSEALGVVDTQTNQIVNSIPLGISPGSIAITPDAKTAYVADEGTETILVVDLQTEQVLGGPIAVGASPWVIAISPDGKTAYVTTEAGTVAVLDTQTNQIVQTVTIEAGGPNLWGVAFSPDGKTAYVANDSAESLAVIDTQTREVVGSPIPVGKGPINVALTPDGKTAYVTNEVSDDVSVIDTQARQNVGTIPVGDEPWGLAITPNGKRAYVANTKDGTVSVIDTQTREVVGSPIPVGERPFEVWVTADGKRAYVANYNSENLAVFDTQTDQVGSPIEDLGGGPWQIVLAPDQSPVPAFSASQPTLGGPVAFNGLASSDVDGSIAVFDWSFGDGTDALNGGGTPSHQYGAPGTYTATLAVTDNEGCSLAFVFTGRTAYCSGSALASHSIAVAPKPVPSNRIRFGKVKKNRKNGTAKLVVKVPGPGALKLSGKKVRAAKATASKAGNVTLTIRAKTKANKVLKRKHRLKVRFQVKFTPTGGTAGSKSKTLTLIRKR